MLSKDNGNPAVCVNNLIQIARGEVPYDRVKGVGILIDQPADQAADDVADDVAWLIGTYEPRAEVESVEVVPGDVNGGHFSIKANINTTKEAEQ